MDAHQEHDEVRPSQIVLIYKASTVVIDGAVKLKFLRRRSFRLIWIVCEAWLGDRLYQEIGGVPPEEVERRCRREDLVRDRNTLNTRWYEEVEMRRSRTGDQKKDEGMMKKIIDIVLLKGAVVPPGVSKERHALKKLRSAFPRVGVSEGAGIRSSSRLFSVCAAPGDVHLCQTWTAAEASGLGPFGETEPLTLAMGGWEFVYLSWVQKVKVNVDGDAETTVSLEAANLSGDILRNLFFWFTLQGHVRDTEPQAKAWLRDGTPLDSQLSVKKDRGLATANLNVVFPGIRLGESIALSFSLGWHGALYPGLHRHGVRLSNPYELFHLQMEFAKPWCVLAPMTFVGETETDAFQPTLLSSNSFEWKRFFPIPHQTYDIYYDLVSREQQKTGKGKSKGVAGGRGQRELLGDGGQSSAD